MPIYYVVTYYYYLFLTKTFFQELLKSGGKSDVPAINIKAENLNQLYDSYEYAMSETKNVIQTEINSKVQKSVDLKRRYKSKPNIRK